jgi:hypothetical protein
MGWMGSKTSEEVPALCDNESNMLIPPVTLNRKLKGTSQRKSNPNPESNRLKNTTNEWSFNPS